MRSMVKESWSSTDRRLVVEGVFTGGLGFFFTCFLGESKTNVFFFLEGFFYNFDPSLDSESFDDLSGDLDFVSTNLVFCFFYFLIVGDSVTMVSVSKGK